MYKIVLLLFCGIDLGIFSWQKRRVLYPSKHWVSGAYGTGNWRFYEFRACWLRILQSVSGLPESWHRNS